MTCYRFSLVISLKLFVLDLITSQLLKMAAPENFQSENIKRLQNSLFLHKWLLWIFLSVLERLSPPAVLQAESVGSLSKWLYYVLLPKGTKVEGQRCCYCSRPSSLKIHHPVIMPGRKYRLSVESSQLQTVYSCLIAFLNLRLQLSLRENGCWILASFAWDCKILRETVVTVKLVVNWIYFWKKLA